MRSVPKKYNTLYKKGHVERDMYAAARSEGCYTVQRLWRLPPPALLDSDATHWS